MPNLFFFFLLWNHKNTMMPQNEDTSYREAPTDNFNGKDGLHDCFHIGFVKEGPCYGLTRAHRGQGAGSSLWALVRSLFFSFILILSFWKWIFYCYYPSWSSTPQIILWSSFIEVIKGVLPCMAVPLDSFASLTSLFSFSFAWRVQGEACWNRVEMFLSTAWYWSNGHQFFLETSYLYEKFRQKTWSVGYATVIHVACFLSFFCVKLS